MPPPCQRGRHGTAHRTADIHHRDVGLTTGRMLPETMIWSGHEQEVCRPLSIDSQDDDPSTQRVGRVIEDARVSGMQEQGTRG